MGSTIVDRDARDGDRRSYVIKNAQALAIGEYVAVEGSSGTVTEVSDVAGLIPLGFVSGFCEKSTEDGTDTGDTSASPTPKVEVDVGGRIEENVSVTGVSASTDVGEQVYATGPDTFTLTPTANIAAVGQVVRHLTGAFTDSFFYSHDAMSAPLV